MDYSKTKRTFTLYFLLIIASVFIYNFAGSSSIYMYIGYSLSLVYLFLAFRTSLRRIKADLFLWGGLILIFGLVGVFLHASHVGDSARSLGVNINLFVPLIYMIILSGISRKKMTIELVNGVVYNFTMISVAIVIVTLAFNLESISSIFSQSSNAYQVALKGFFPNKNMFGDFTAMAAIMNIYLVCVRKKKLLFVTLALLVLVTLLTFCRAALLLLALFTVLFLSMSIFGVSFREERKRIRILQRMVSLVLFLSVLLFAFNPPFHEFILNKVLRLDIGDAGRSTIQMAAYSLIRSNGLLEYLFGYGASELEYHITQDLHNTYLNVFLTGGIVKILLYFYGLVISLRRNLRNRHCLISRFSLCCLLSYLAYAFFETVVYFELGLFSFEILFVILFIPLSVDMTSVERSAR